MVKQRATAQTMENCFSGDPWNQSHASLLGEHRMEDGLEEGATSIALRGLSRNYSVELLARLLDEISGNYDFLYVPKHSKRDKNIGLAFINFSDHASAHLCFEKFRQLQTELSGTVHSFRTVSQANVQGLGPNLAFYTATAGGTSKSAASLQAPPFVFENGVQIDWRDAVRKHCSMGDLCEAGTFAHMLKQKNNTKLQEISGRAPQVGGSQSFNSSSPSTSSSFNSSSQGHGLPTAAQMPRTPQGGFSQRCAVAPTALPTGLRVAHSPWLDTERLHAFDEFQTGNLENMIFEL